ncbi:peptidyl-tRNA hydrolase [Hydrogenophilus thermoluteolus]|uniref:aminoacyl-tRNA hydrolase n=1 Tax=Hydrogenophilus thermoluteolus TaxID=297 RepID=UPI0024A4E4D8|nr:aminoacyl-tRNA hydrolase [Hydrogenophilus thermoluteolus]GLW60315.1 peptidyl-tRNA hydrolase [Hydrogenophilus thermoluteolus]
MSGHPIPPQLVVGLGNPGREYEATRHNIGFWWVDQLARTLGATFHPEARFFGEVARAGTLRLLKPTTYMNRSGQAVAALARFFRIPPEAILVVHDELDLPPGRARLKFGGGTAGHNGLKDIRAQLGSDRFWRLRLGIGHPGDRNQVANYVLHPPRAEERALLEQVLTDTLACWPLIARGDWSRAQQRIHALAPPTPSLTPQENRS